MRAFRTLFKRLDLWPQNCLAKAASDSIFKVFRSTSFHNAYDYSKFSKKCFFLSDSNNQASAEKTYQQKVIKQQIYVTK